MKRELEALLFATDSPLTVGRLKKIFPDADTAELKATVAELQADYEGHEHAFTIIEFGGGYQIATKPEFSPIVEKMLKTRRFTRLSKAGLEVLAIIAYKQPLTRMEVDEIRGVNSSGAISTLTERSLITVVGRSQAVGNPLLYGTTREFLNHLGLRGLGQLPDLPDLENVMDDRDELKEFAAKVGREVSDEELEEYFTVPETGSVAEESTGEAPNEESSTEESSSEESSSEGASTDEDSMNEATETATETESVSEPDPAPAGDEEDVSDKQENAAE